LLNLIERGKQVGVSIIISVDGKNMVYTYAIQKVREKYISYTNEYDLDEVYSNDWDTDKTEKVVVYENINDFLDNFTVKYDIIFNKFNVSKGQKFFYTNSYLDLL